MTKGQRKKLWILAAAAIACSLMPGLAHADDSLLAAGSVDIPGIGAPCSETLSTQGSNASATVAIHRVKTQRYFKPGDACPKGLNEGWLRYDDGATDCSAECYAFACGVCEALFGRHPSGIMDTGYTCKDPNGFECVGSLKDPTLRMVVNLMLQAYPGDYLQFCSGGGWGTAQHSAIVESVDANGVCIYQHGDLSHVSSTYYPWNEFYYSYLGMDKKNFRGYAGLGLYHAANYEETFGAGTDTPGPDDNALGDSGDDEFSDDFADGAPANSSPAGDSANDPFADDFADDFADAEMTTVKASSRFTDLDAKAWYLNKTDGAFPGTSTLYLDYAVGKGLMSGYSGTKLFGPDDTLTRGMAATIIHRLATGCTAATADNDVRTDFSDVEPGRWYAAAVAWCADKGVVTGYRDSGKFGPDDPVTREQLATMIARYCQNVKHLAHVEADISGFSDFGRISDWARAEVAFCVACDIVSGMGDTGAFAPRESATRCQMAKIIAVTARLTE